MLVSLCTTLLTQENKILIYRRIIEANYTGSPIIIINDKLFPRFNEIVGLSTLIIVVDTFNLVKLYYSL